eukprot:Rhum_TRINITY_DN16613_c0_g1::Rhum_TRINITY_DN16613_c0_g1_i1::g.163834::m.163834
MPITKIPKSVTSFKRRGGGKAGGLGVRDYLAQETVAGGIGWTAGEGMKTTELTPFHQNSYQKREDLAYSLRGPSKGSVASKMKIGTATNPQWEALRVMGVRQANPRVELHSIKNEQLERRDQLIKYCKDCYFWTDGLYQYNLCTMKNDTHWHRKATPVSLQEGYRPIDRMGGRFSTRSNAFALPVHRLGTPFPNRGNRKEHYGNPAKGDFDKWLVWRRWNRVGTGNAAKRYGFEKMFFFEL